MNGERSPVERCPAGMSASSLNWSCFCIRPDPDVLRLELAPGLRWPLQESHPGLFSSLPVFVAEPQLRDMDRLIAAIEQVVAHPAYQAAALADAPAIASELPITPGVLEGFDFHLTDAGARLIEINTNAGGVLLVARLLSALRCELGMPLPKGPDEAAVRLRLWQMFDDVWRRSRGELPLRRVAIVDQVPADQYLYPEFLLFQRWFEEQGVQVVIADPRELRYASGRLLHSGAPIDMVYNRLTDFYLGSPECAALSQAAREDSVLLTPNPRAHALYANKRNLARLTDARQLRAWGVPDATVETLQAGIPATEEVSADAAESLWRRRKGLFFKPADGFGSRGSYRGDKVTRRVFERILGGDYVAQSLIPPSGRAADPGEPGRRLKFDVRNYTYGGRVLLRAARLYAGQTTNFRTPGGGFAPVIRVAA